MSTRCYEPIDIKSRRLPSVQRPKLSRNWMPQHRESSFESVPLRRIIERFACLKSCGVRNLRTWIFSEYEIWPSQNVVAMLQNWNWISSCRMSWTSNFIPLHWDLSKLNSKNMFHKKHQNIFIQNLNFCTKKKSTFLFWFPRLSKSKSLKVLACRLSTSTRSQDERKGWRGRRADIFKFLR